MQLYRYWLFKQLKADPTFLEPLRGKDLVCFCKLTQPCHADIIIEFMSKYDGKHRGFADIDPSEITQLLTQGQLISG